MPVNFHPESTLSSSTLTEEYRHYLEMFFPLEVSVDSDISSVLVKKNISGSVILSKILSSTTKRG